MKLEPRKNLSDYTQPELLSMFRERLKTFPSQKGERNNQLLSLVHVGLRAGLSDDRIENEISDGSGEPPLTIQEIRHALDTAHTSIERFRPGPRKQEKPPLGPRAKDYVPQMIELGRGATMDQISGLSPLGIPPGPRDQTMLFLSTLYAEGDLIYIGPKNGIGEPGLNIRPVADWKKQPGLRGPLIISNPLTGKKGIANDGTPSYRCKDSVKSFFLGLTEADKMPLDMQACFWVGVLKSETLPLRSLVYSGGKSIHGLIELAVSGLQEWETEISKLMHAVAHPSLPLEQRADPSCRNPDRMSRLPGVIRPETQKMQQLLWLSPQPLGI